MHAISPANDLNRSRPETPLGTLAGWSIAGLIATLPLSWLRISGISAVFIFAGLGVAVFIIRIIIEDKRFRAPFIDWVIAAYLLYSIVLISKDASIVVVLKSVVYFIAYFALRSNIEYVKNRDRWLVRGAIAGIIAFATILLIGSVLSGLTISDFLSFSYWRVTYKALGFFVVDIKDVGNAALMRNTVSNSLLLLTVIYAVNGKMSLLMLSAFEIFIMQSRRGVIGLGYVIAATGKFNWKKLLLVIIAAAVVIWIVGAVEAGQIETRLDSLDDATRNAQLLAAWRAFPHRFWFGAGYGETIFGYYIHNFVLASAYMCGVFAFLLSIYIVAYAIFQLFGRSPYRSAMIVFLANTMLSPTVEGIFSMEAWTALALVAATLAPHSIPAEIRTRPKRRSITGLPPIYQSTDA